MPNFKFGLSADLPCDHSHEDSVFTFCAVTFEKGASFGELALLKKNCKREATIIAETNQQIATLDRKTFHDLILQEDLRVKKEMVTFLRQIPAFKDMTQKQLTSMFYNLVKIECLRKQYAYMQGAPAHKVYIVA